MDLQGEMNMNKLTRTEKAARFDAFVSNDDNFIAVEFNDPRAVALRAKAAARFHKTEKARAARTEQTAAQASAFIVGQTVCASHRFTGEVVAIDGAVVSVNVAGTVRKFLASAVAAA